MVKRYAIVRNNIVENVILIDGDPSWYTVDGGELVDVDLISVGPGFIRNDDGTFADPHPTQEATE